MFSLVSVVMPVYNASPYIKEAIQSILNQTYPHFELIIINDGSADDSGKIIQSFHDNRIRYIEHESNKGIAKIRREGIEQARGQFLFWMDADDVSLPTRMEKQVALFEKDPGLILAGTFAEGIDHAGNHKKYYRYVTGDKALKAGLIFGFPFMNPSLCIRMSALKQADLSFLDEVTYAQDYVIISKLFLLGSFENIPECLVKYREFDSPTRITKDANSNQIINGRIFAWTCLLEPLGAQISREMMLFHDKISYYPNRILLPETPHFHQYLVWLEQLKQENRKINLFDQDAFETNIATFAVRTLCHPLLSISSFTGLWFKHASLIKRWDWLKIPWKRTKYAAKKQIKLLLAKP
jgi:glycosyltransferase involved in cell wall biosynthesis